MQEPNKGYQSKPCLIPTLSLDRSHDPAMGNVLECFVAPGTQQRDEVPLVVRRDVGFTHSAVKSEDHSERTGLEASEGVNATQLVH